MYLTIHTLRSAPAVNYFDQIRSPDELRLNRSPEAEDFGFSNVYTVGLSLDGTRDLSLTQPMHESTHSA